jgi:hypothetical protein
MNETDLTKLRELTLLLDLAYLHHFRGDSRNYKSAEASIRLEFGNFWYRKDHPPGQAAAPLIETVLVYSSVWSAARLNYFDTLDEALTTIRGWYEHARANSAPDALT